MTTSSNAQPNVKAFFNIHTTGIGFLKRIREVKPKGKKSDAFLACSISALSGPADQPVYRYFDVRVSGAKAQDLVRSYMRDVEAGRTVLIDFRLGDLWPDLFVRTTGEHAGETAVNLKGRLLKASVLDVSVLQQMVHHRLITHGIGYIKRIFPGRGNTSLRRCSIAALNGPTDEAEYRYFDVNVTDPLVAALLDQYADDIRAKRKVLISFQLEDMQTDFFTRTKGEDVGERVPFMKSTLSNIAMVKVDGNEVYRAKPKAITEAVVQAAPVTASELSAPESSARPDSSATSPEAEVDERLAENDVLADEPVMAMAG
ncbi:DUF3577 domain-containing protein [Collimonas silvisoli]|uniref:DUF3577 domain-containing protein n=1 Tax=Collimonas silvisoli TaxID=2825884 RepID=UPI001B8B8635|nr:DUF3577 domain-containing protein [Collimonas silvisoli]